MNTKKLILEAELETYKNELPNLLADAGKYVLIHDHKVQGVFGTYEDALNAGYQACGNKPFLVKQIQAVETIQYFTRDLLLCH